MLRLSTLEKIRSVFEKNNWYQFGNADKCFDSFCQMISFFDEDQKELILELTQNFLKVGMSEYTYYLTKTLEVIDKELFEGYDDFYILPLLHPKDFGKSKSSTYIAYMFQSSEIKRSNLFTDKNVSVIDKPEQLPSEFNNIPAKLLLVDDFIGTGDTAINCINYLNNEGINIEKLILLTFVIQEEGLERIQKEGAQVTYYLSRNKGINDNYHGNKKACYIKKMQEIEGLLKVKRQYRFGYKRSEALVSMLRTPNNTFPVFWWNTVLNNGERFISPFPR